jgi:hypothetical protein
VTTSHLTGEDFNVVTISNNLAKIVDPQKEIYYFRGHTVLARLLRRVPRLGPRSNFTGLDGVGIGETFERSGNRGKMHFESGAGVAASLEEAKQVLL